jgi:arylformamidase
VLHRPITDWDDAYANAANIPGGERWPEAWAAPARRYREEMQANGRMDLDLPYGPHGRHRLDLFMPARESLGLVVYVHGGYWKAYDKSHWSHLAQGALESGHAVAIPSYRLCPEVRIGDIAADIGAAISHLAARLHGPIDLAGHSAGGHLVTRMITATMPLGDKVRARIRNVVSISGLHDLRPLLRTSMNETLKIDEDEARRESPALLVPLAHPRITCWVGGAERAEFRRQNALLANIWTGLGANVCAVEEPDRHHFDIVEGLCQASHPLTMALLRR